VSDETLGPTGDRDVELTELWRLEAPLRSVVDGGDPTRDPWTMVPGLGGLAWRLVRWTISSPRMHQTDTLDFLILLDGRIELEFETGRVRLGAGDSLVIQDALHAWHLIDGEPCTALAVMLRPSHS
jgi:mannose-6-phosphate isomerase-like protein (cupin superfamily)